MEIGKTLGNGWNKKKVLVNLLQLTSFNLFIYCFNHTQKKYFNILDIYIVVILVKSLRHQY